jgi:hypothetical protein
MSVFISSVGKYLTFTKQTGSRNFSDFGKAPLYSEEKNGLLDAFPKAFPESGRVLGTALP